MLLQSGKVQLTIKDEPSDSTCNISSSKSASEFADPRCRGSFPAQLEVRTLPNVFDQSGPETRDTVTASVSYASVKNSVRPILQKGYSQPLRYFVIIAVMVTDEFAS